MFIGLSDQEKVKFHLADYRDTAGHQPSAAGAQNDAHMNNLKMLRFHEFRLALQVCENVKRAVTVMNAHRHWAYRSRT
jgi:hypothetical protein